MQHPDADLVSAAQAGDAAAFDSLMLRYQEKVFAVAYHILGNAEDAADVQQEAFVRAWTKLGSFRGDACFSTWLHRIAVNICLSKRRRPQPISGLDQDQVLAHGADAPDCSGQLLDAVVVRDLLDTIPAKQRTLLVLREVEGMTLGEIAETVGSTVEAVRKQLWRGRKLFGTLLRQQLGEDRL